MNKVHDCFPLKIQISFNDYFFISIVLGLSKFVAITRKLINQLFSLSTAKFV